MLILGRRTAEAAAVTGSHPDAISSDGSRGSTHELTPLGVFDFGAQLSPLDGGRTEAFRYAINEIARTSQESIEQWSDRLSVGAGSVESVSLEHLNRSETLQYFEFFLSESGQAAYICLDTEMALSMLSTVLGGNGDPGLIRPLTPLEIGLLGECVGQIMQRFADELQLGALRFRHHHADQRTIRDSRQEPLISLTLELRSPQHTSTLTVAVSPLSLQPWLDVVDRRINGAPRSGPRAHSAVANALKPVVVDVVAGLVPVTISTADIAALSPGDVIRTDHSLSRALIIRVGGSAVFGARAGQRDERLIAEITELYAPYSPTSEELQS